MDFRDSFGFLCRSNITTQKRRDFIWVQYYGCLHCRSVSAATGAVTAAVKEGAAASIIASIAAVTAAAE